MNPILVAVILIGLIALVLSVILYVISKKFSVQEDPRIAQIVEVIPGANCGGCGFAGCSALASAIVASGSLQGRQCPVGGAPVMEKVAAIMGLQAEASEPRVAVVRCSGSCENRPRLNVYDGVHSCAVSSLLYGGETACQWGCVGCGDCVRACKFGAITMDPLTGLPKVDEERCTACGACQGACPKGIIELRNRGKKGRRVYVSCVSHDKGAQARKACKAACIGCGLCQKACAFEAITVSGNLAYIDFTKCRLCRKCVEACPQHAIIELNFPPRVPRTDKPASIPEPAARPDSGTREMEVKTN